MAISTTQSSVVLLGNGVTTQWSIPYIMDSAQYINVYYTDSSGTQTLLSPSQYTLTLNPPSTDQIWGIGGTLLYPLMGSPIANGTSLTVSRVLPLTQTITIANQGAFSPEVVEEMGDTLAMQIQQVAARTGAVRGVWASGIVYNYADIVIDGTHGSNTGNFYLCAVANTSGTWATDLANGDWVLAIPVVNSAVYTSLTVTGGAAFNLGNNPFILITTNGTITIESLFSPITIASISSTLTISSGATGNLDNMTIGASTPADATVNAFHATNTTTLDAGANLANDATFTSAAKGVTYKRGSNGRVGTVTLTGTTAVTVNNTIIATSDLISFSLNKVGGTVGAYPVIKTITPSSGFTVAGTAGDTSVYNYYVTKSSI